MKSNDNGTIVPFSGNQPDSSARIAYARNAILQRLSDGDEEPFGLTYEKFVDRCTGVRESEHGPGKFVFSIERHRAIAGCVYTRGLPMSAFETYTQEILFDPDTGTISDCGEVHVDNTIYVSQLAEEQMDDYRPHVEMRIDGKGIRRVEVNMINWSIETSSREEARSALGHEISSLNYESCMEHLEMSEEERSDYIQRLEDASVEFVLSRFDEAWANPELI